LCRRARGQNAGKVVGEVAGKNSGQITEMSTSPRAERTAADAAQTPDAWRCVVVAVGVLRVQLQRTAEATSDDDE